jgi:hypothetical protein
MLLITSADCSSCSIYLLHRCTTYTSGKRNAVPLLTTARKKAKNSSEKEPHTHDDNGREIMAKAAASGGRQLTNTDGLAWGGGSDGANFGIGEPALSSLRPCSLDHADYLGRTVVKQFPGHNGEWFKGTVKSWNASIGFHVVYEDGDEEDLDLDDVLKVLAPNAGS